MRLTDHEYQLEKMDFGTPAVLAACQQDICILPSVDFTGQAAPFLICEVE